MAKILIIEDEEPVRANLIELLDAEGYDTLQGADGITGVNLARNENPDLIICDIFMPGVGGYGVLSALNKDETTAAIPFIFLTALTERDDQRKGMELGADDFISKPFTRQEILKAIQTRLGKKSSLEERVRRQVTALSRYINISLPHELLTPLSMILEHSRMLSDEGSTLSRPEIATLAREIQQAASRLLSSIRDYSLYTEMESAMQNSNRLNAMRSAITPSAAAILREIVQVRMSAENRLDDLRLELEDAPIAIAEVYLQEIIEKLLDRQLRYSFSGTPVRLTGRADVTSGEYRIELEEHGNGAIMAQIQSAQDPESMPRNLTEEAGVDLGLLLMKRLVEIHSGRLEVKNQDAENGSYQVILPLARIEK
jgi:two-component system sensor histidine kinase/response regulator